MKQGSTDSCAPEPRAAFGVASGSSAFQAPARSRTATSGPPPCGYSGRVRRPAAAWLLAGVLCAAAAGCGGSGSDGADGASETTTAPASSRWRRSGVRPARTWRSCPARRTTRRARTASRSSSSTSSPARSSGRRRASGCRAARGRSRSRDDGATASRSASRRRRRPTSRGMYVTSLDRRRRQVLAPRRAGRRARGSRRSATSSWDGSARRRRSATAPSRPKTPTLASTGGNMTELTTSTATRPGALPVVGGGGARGQACRSWSRSRRRSTARRGPAGRSSTWSPPSGSG